MTFADTRYTAPVRGLPDYKFDQTKFWVRDGMRTVHGWVNTRTGDSASKFPTKKEAVKSAKAFEKGLRAEERGEKYMDQFEGASEDWLYDEIQRIHEAQENSPVTDPALRAFWVGMLKGCYNLLDAQRHYRISATRKDEVEPVEIRYADSERAAEAIYGDLVSRYPGAFVWVVDQH